jgi:hypothetical protein
MLQWLQAHPALVTLAIPFLTALFNWACKPRTQDEYLAMSPRAAAFFRFMASTFPDPAGIINAVWQAWANTHELPPPPPPPEKQ